MENILLTLGYAALTIWIYATMWFVIALLAKRNDLADFAWGIGFIVVTFVTLALRGSYTTVQTLVALLVLAWGVRLAVHIGTRMIGKKEDYRYKAWRDEWGKWFIPRTYGQVFLLQGLFMLAVCVPMIILNSTAESDAMTWNAWIGLVIWSIGFFFETVGDWQLRAFIKDPNRTGIMTDGLWKYTRHPNYFGEVTQWWGIWILMLHVPFGWLGVIGPLAITFSILKLSGIPMLERKYDDNAEFQEYKKRTSAFFPMPQKK
jgi:steroid 5-alpha reductase family enzyme